MGSEMMLSTPQPLLDTSRCPHEPVGTIRRIMMIVQPIRLYAQSQALLPDSCIVGLVPASFVWLVDVTGTKVVRGKVGGRFQVGKYTGQETKLPTMRDGPVSSE